MTDLEDKEFDFVENGINKSLYMTWIEDAGENGKCDYELRVNVLDYDDPFDELDSKNSKIQFTYKGKHDDCEIYSSKAKCRKRFNQLVKEIKN